MQHKFRINRFEVQKNGRIATNYSMESYMAWTAYVGAIPIVPIFKNIGKNSIDFLRFS